MHPFKLTLGKKIGSSWIQRLIGLKTNWRFEELYGDFDFGRSFRKQSIEGLEQESGKVHGAIVDFLRSAPVPISRLLLAGDSTETKAIYSRILEIDIGNIITAGVMDDMDVEWNYEQSPPENIGQFDCIVSQSMLEHLLDPFKHIQDSIELLNSGGVLIIHTMMPGFNYHRHPVDCLRFYPDWFEEIAKRHALKIVRKHIRNCRITYALQKA